MNPANYMPETALQVLGLFSTSKESIQNFSNQIIREVKEGRADALRIKVYLKTLEQIIEQIDTNTKSEQRTEAEKYGERPFDFMGASIQVVPVKTDYDYSLCNDAYLQTLEISAERIAQKIKARKELLKTLGEPTPLGDPETGEIYTVYPPIKKAQTGIKVSIK